MITDSRVRGEGARGVLSELFFSARDTGPVCAVGCLSRKVAGSGREGACRGSLWHFHLLSQVHNSEGKCPPSEL